MPVDGFDHVRLCAGSMLEAHIALCVGEAFLPQRAVGEKLIRLVRIARLVGQWSQTYR